jgi:hypothetical protein
MAKLMPQGTKKTGVGLRPQPNPNFIHAANMTELWNRANDSIIWAPHHELSYWSSLDSMISDCIGLADEATFDIDIGKELWVTPARWNTLCRQYVDPERLFKWLEGVKDISTYKRGINAMDMQPVQRTVVASNARANRRKWGGCMRMVTYRAFPQPTVTLFSRTSYLGYIGGLDMLLAYKLIEQACDMIGEGLHPRDFQFRWVCDSWQFHGFKSLAYLFASKQDKFMRISEKKWEANVGRTLTVNGQQRVLEPLDNYPTWKLIRYWWARIQRQDDEGKRYKDMKYGAEKRIRRRYHAQTKMDVTRYTDSSNKSYLPLSTPIELITLDRMLYKTPESRAIMRKQKLEKEKVLIERLLDNDDLILD